MTQLSTPQGDGRVARLRHAASLGLAAAVAVLMAPAQSLSDWSPQGNRLSTLSSYQPETFLSCRDRDGVFVVWTERRNSPLQHDIYAQRFTPFGDVALGWPNNGVLVCGARGEQDGPSAAIATGGDLIVEWRDGRSGRAAIYAQRLDAGGGIAAGWPADGIAIATRGPVWASSIVSDDEGGAFFSWLDVADDPRVSVRLQHLSANGLVASGWPDTGLVVAVSDSGLTSIACEDGQGGVLLSVLSFTSFTGSRLSCHRILASGEVAPGWPAAGVVATSTCDIFNTRTVLPSGDGGALLAWQDTRNDEGDIYVTRLTHSGTVAPEWPAEGLPTCTASGVQTSPQACSDRSGGIVVAWSDSRSGAYDIYAGRVTAAGALSPGWPTEGAVVCAALRLQFLTGIADDGTGGAVVVWADYRDDPAETLPRPYAQRVRGDGAVADGWPVNGLALIPGSENAKPQRVVSDGESGAYITWADFYLSRAYIQRVGAGGNVAPPPPAASLVLYPANPNPSTGTVNITFVLRNHGVAAATVLDTGGRRVRQLMRPEAQDAGAHVLTWDGKDDDGRQARPGIYFARVTAGDSRLTERFAMIR